MRGGGIQDRIKNTALSVGGKLLKIGSKTLAKKLKDSDNPRLKWPVQSTRMYSLWLYRNQPQPSLHHLNQI